jgi:hypothetical protein
MAKCTRDFKNAIGKRVGNEFFIRLNRLDYAFPNAFPNAFVNAFSNAFTNAFPNAFDHWFSNVLNGPVFDIVFLRHLNVSKIKNIRFPEKELRRE